MDDLDRYHTVDILNELKRRYACLSKPEGNYIFVGPPGGGKTTQANYLLKSHCYCHINPDYIFKYTKNFKRTSDFKSKNPLDHGSQPSEQLLDNLEQIIQMPQCKRGFIIDGLVNSESYLSKVGNILSKMGVKLDAVINFEIDDQTAEKRLVNRLFHERSGRIYNKITMPPNNSERDDVTDEQLTQSSSDRPSFILDRLKAFRNEYSGIIRGYSELGLLKTVDATKSPSQVQKLLGNIIEETGRK